VKSEEDKCHNKFCGSSPCDCPSALFDNENNEDDDEEELEEADGSNNDANNSSDSTHWALQVLYEDLGMFSS